MNDLREEACGTTPASPTRAAAVAAPEGDLKTMRADLDRIDERLLECIRERIDCCKSIALYKRTFSVPMMQPHRIDAVQERAARFGRQHGIGLEFLRQLYAVIIDETCRVEEVLIDSASTDQADRRRPTPRPSREG